jgi:plastocyanin
MRGFLRIGILVTCALFICGFMVGTIRAYATMPASRQHPITITPSTPTPNVQQPLTATIVMSSQDGTFTFTPATQTVKVGATIEWHNSTSAPHTVVGFGKDAGIIASGQTFKATFTQAGTFTYVCSYHPGMSGTIVVVP